MHTKLDHSRPRRVGIEGGQEFERTDSKINRLVYFIVGGLVVKGRLDFYLLKGA